MLEKKEIKKEDLEKVDGGGGPLLEPIDYYCNKCKKIFMGNIQNYCCPTCKTEGTRVKY